MIDLSMCARQRADAYYQQAAAAGHVRAMGRLGRMYLLGNAVERDSLTTYLWLAKAVSAPHTLPDTGARNGRATVMRLTIGTNGAMGHIRSWPRQNGRRQGKISLMHRPKRPDQTC